MLFRDKPIHHIHNSFKLFIVQRVALNDFQFLLNLMKRNQNDQTIIYMKETLVAPGITNSRDT